MNIKEAAAGAGLNERAVKIYVSRGLVSPKKQETLRAEKFEFSHEDVEKLKYISQLRKLGITFKQLKALDGGGDKARTLLTGIATGKVTMKAVCYIDKPADDAEVTLKSASVALAPFVPEKAVNPDLEISRTEVVYRTFLSIFVPLTLLVILWEGYYVLSEYMYYQYPVFNGNFVTLFVFLMIPLAAGFDVVLVVRALKWDAVEHRGVVLNISAILMTVFVIFHVILSPATIVFCGFIPFIECRTDDPKNYLDFTDKSELFMSEIDEIFPDDISLPGSDGKEFAETTKYHYELDYVIDPENDVYTEWMPSREVFDSEVERLLDVFADAETKTVGGYRVYTLKTFWSVKQFAYNEDTGVIMYGYATRYEWHDTYFDKMFPKS